jgi:hypothetical protein
MALLLGFLMLQLLDGWTTMLFLHRGVAEGNPLLSFVFHFSLNPALSLVLVKLAAAGLALYAWRSGRTRLLARANWFFCACVAWNLVAIAAA